MSKFEVETRHGKGDYVVRAFGGSIGNHWLTVEGVMVNMTDEPAKVLYVLRRVNSSEATENASEANVMKLQDLDGLIRALNYMREHALGGPVELFLPNLLENIENTLAAAESLVKTREEMLECQKHQPEL